MNAVLTVITYIRESRDVQQAAERRGGTATCVPEHLTIQEAVGSWHSRLWNPLITRNLTHNNRVYEAGGLTEGSQLLVLNRHRFAWSLLPSRRTAAVGRVLQLWGQLVWGQQRVGPARGVSQVG